METDFLNASHECSSPILVMTVSPAKRSLVTPSVLTRIFPDTTTTNSTPS